MIQDHNLNITEPEYRDLENPSYSLLASMSKQGVDVLTGTVKGGFFQLKFGSLVDDMCFEPSKLVNYYHGVAQKPPTGHPKTLIDNVLEGITMGVGQQQVSQGLVKTRTRKITDNINHYQSEIVANARALGIYKNYDEKKIMESISKGADYFADKLNSRGKIHIKPEMWDNAEIAADTLRTHDFTRIYFDAEEGVEIFYQFKAIKRVNGVQVKVMLDCLVVDHNNKTIYPVDLKTGEAPASMFNEVILLHKYYLQASLYRCVIKKIVEDDPDLAGYTVAPFEFVYLSKVNLYKPLIWVTPEELHIAGFKGFTDRFGFKHKGLNQLLKEYVDCKKGLFCQYTKEEYEDDGRVMLNNLIKSTND